MRVLRGLAEARAALIKPTPWLNPAASPGLAAFLRRAFGREVTPWEAIGLIVAEVREGGDEALRDLARRFDNVELPALEVGREEVARAYDRVDRAVIDALHLAAAEIEAFHRQQVRTSWLDYERGVGQMVRPLQRAGLYVPGGRAAYPSTVLMTAIPARQAGVPEVVVTTPARERGQVPPVTLVACSIAKVDRVFRLGGPHAIVALALGTESVPRVDKVFGPGNLLVQLAKRAVYGIVGVDTLQGPSETIIVADDSSDPALCAADLLAQAEHDADARPVLVTTAERLLPRVERELERQLRDLPEDSAAPLSLRENGAFVLVASLDEAVALCNAFAPEHLCLLVRDPWPLVPRLTAAGGIFIGAGSPEVLGDYVAGPSHVMPTSGAAAFSSPLSVFDFLKVTSVVAVPPERVRRIGPAAAVIARAEGLPAHARAVELRLPPIPDGA